MSDVTRILTAIEQGDAKAADQLLPLVYEELRRLAAQKMYRSSLATRFKQLLWFTKPTSG